MIIVMYYDQSDERSYIYYVKLPEIEHKFAIGCKNLRSANVGYIIDLGKIKLSIMVMIKNVHTCN